MKLKGETVVITGASSGLGLELVKLFLARHCTVVGIARNSGSGRMLQSAVKSSDLYVETADIRDFGAVDTIAAKYPHTAVLVNNAGIWAEGGVESLSADQIKTVIDANLTGLILTTKAFLPALRNNNYGFIINIISSSGIKARAGESVYDASKHGVHGYTESLRQDLANTGIRVVGIYPGGMDTGFFTKGGSEKDTSWWMKPQQIAEIIIHALERDDNLVMDHIEINKRKA